MEMRCRLQHDHAENGKAVSDLHSHEVPAGRLGCVAAEHDGYPATRPF